MLKQKLKDARAVLKTTKVSLRATKGDYVSAHRSFNIDPQSFSIKELTVLARGYLKAQKNVAKAVAKVDTLISKLEG